VLTILSHLAFVLGLLVTVGGIWWLVRWADKSSERRLREDYRRSVERILAFRCGGSVRILSFDAGDKPVLVTYLDPRDGRQRRATFGERAFGAPFDLLAEEII
jgi:hypothetical protein